MSRLHILAAFIQHFSLLEATCYELLKGFTAALSTHQCSSHSCQFYDFSFLIVAIKDIIPQVY